MSSGAWTFFQAFLKSPKTVASMIPSSPFLERRLVKAARLDSAGTVVELGSGTGGTTRALLKAMPDGSNLLAMERTGEFVAGLNRIGDPRLHVVHGCASTLATELESRGLGPADAVISGIPFSTLPPDLCKQIIAAVHDALRPQGRFVAYQFSGRVADYARPLFGSPHREHEVRNVPPLKVFTWEKAPDSAVA